jgi:hypothetical protein
MTMVEYIIYDRRNGAEVARSVQPDYSPGSENAAIREGGIPGQFAEIVTREISADTARPWVGRRSGDAR